MIDIIHAVGKNYSESVLIAGTINPRNNPLGEGITVEKIVPSTGNQPLKD